jgi:hypothetical protein
MQKLLIFKGYIKWVKCKRKVIIIILLQYAKRIN